MKNLGIFLTLAFAVFFAVVWGEDQPFNGIPDGVDCIATLWCGSKTGVCSTVCEKGSVVIDAWQKYAMSTQIKLSRMHGLCYSQFLGTHNSGIDKSDGYGNGDPLLDPIMEKLVEITGNEDIRWETSNHYLTLTDQLNLGMRHIELDTHWIFQELSIAHCGGVGFDQIDEAIANINEKLAEKTSKQIKWDSESIGCFPSGSMIFSKDQRSFDSAVQEMSDWFGENEDQFVIIMLDVQHEEGNWNSSQSMLAVFDKYFEGKYYTPTTLQDEDGSVFPSVNELSGRGYQLLISTTKDLGDDMTSSIFTRDMVCGWNEANVDELNEYPTCSYYDSDNEVVMNEGTFTRVVSSEIQYGPLNEGGHLGNDWPVLDEDSIPDVVKCNTGLLAGDNMVTSRARAAIWSWREDEPNNMVSAEQSEMCVVLNGNDGRWSSLDCSSTSPQAVLCFTKDDSPYGSYSILSLSGGNSYEDASQVCTENGYDEVGTPGTAFINAKLTDQMNEQEAQLDQLWIGWKI